MKVYQFKKIAGSVLALSLLIAGCGKSNATKDYQNLNLTPAHNQVSAQQLSAAGSMLRISVLTNGEDSSVSTFSEGEPGQVQIKVDKLNSSITGVSLSLTSSPVSGMTLTASTTDASIWNLNWTPPKITNATSNFPITITAYGQLSGSNPIAVSTPRTQQIVVTHMSGNLRIVSVVAPAKVNEGEDALITVQVSDSATGNTLPPTVTTAPYTQVDSEDPHINGQHFVAPQSGAISMGGGVYSYKFILNSRGEKIYRSSDKSQPGTLYCTNFIAANSDQGVASAEYPLCVRILFKTQPAYAMWDNDPGKTTPIDLVVGKPNTISFTVQTANGTGNISVKSSNKFASWPSEAGGQINFAPENCVASGPNGDSSVLKCSLTWTPSCKAKKFSKVISFELENNFDGQKVASSVQHDLTFSKRDPVCDVAPVTPAVTDAAPVPTAKTKRVAKKLPAPAASAPLSNSTTDQPGASDL